MFYMVSNVVTLIFPQYSTVAKDVFALTAESDLECHQWIKKLQVCQTRT